MCCRKNYITGFPPYFIRFLEIVHFKKQPVPRGKGAFCAHRFLNNGGINALYLNKKMKWMYRTICCFVLISENRRRRRRRWEGGTKNYKRKKNKWNAAHVEFSFLSNFLRGLIERKRRTSPGVSSQPEAVPDIKKLFGKRLTMRWHPGDNCKGFSPTSM